MKRFIGAAVLLLLACDRGTPAPRAYEPQRGVIDSIFPVEEEIRRFKAQVGGPFPSELAHSASSREELTRRLIGALEEADTTALRNMLIDAREFIALYYPYSQYTKSPYKQSPDLLWFLMSQQSEKGISRALSRFGGEPVGFRVLECKPDPVIQERNRLWDCLVRWKAAERKPDPIKLFGAIMERNGRFKFLSYSNDL
jgi:hypothetical protein